MTGTGKLCLALSVAALQAACGSSSNPSDDEPRLAVNGGDNQQELPGQNLAQPLRVLVAESGQPVSGVTINWAVTAGGGSVNPASSVTNQDGIASTVHRLGATLGTNTVEATSPDAIGTARFSAEAVEELDGKAVLVAQVPIPPDYGIHDTHVRDGIAFVAAWNSGIWIYDVGGGSSGGSPSAPKLISKIVTPSNGVPGGPQAHNSWWFHNPVKLEKRYLFVGQEGPGTIGANASGDLHVVDVSDLANPVAVASLRVPGAGVHNFWMAEDDQVLYAAWYNGGVVAVDVSGTLSGDLSNRIVGQGFPGGAGSSYTWGVMLGGPAGRLYAADMVSGLYVMDPFTLTTHTSLPTLTDRFTSDLWIHGTTAYTGTWGNRGGNRGDVLNIWSIQGSGVPVFVRGLPIPGAGTVSDVAVTPDGRVLVVTGESGSSGNGLHLFDRVDPLNPVALDFASVSTGLHTGEVAVIDGRTYVFAARNPPNPALMIFDITDVGK